jgi:hypothetical protein
VSELDVWRQLAGEAERGHLRLRVSREGLDAAVKHLQDYIDAIDLMRPLVGQVARVDGFGSFQLGEDLAAKFSARGSGVDGIAQRFDELAAAAVAIQDTIRKAAAVYVEADGQAAAAIGRAGEQL